MTKTLSPLVASSFGIALKHLTHLGHDFNLSSSAGYTGQTTYFGPGYNYAFMASSSVFDSTASMSWRVDGNVVSIAPTSSEAKYRCPKSTNSRTCLLSASHVICTTGVKLVSEITINCMEEDLQNAALALREKLITMMEDVRAAQSYPESILTVRLVSQFPPLINSHPTLLVPLLRRRHS